MDNPEGQINAEDAPPTADLQVSEPPASVNDEDVGEEILVEPVEEGAPEAQGAMEDDMEEEWFDYEDNDGGDSLGEADGDLSLFDSDEGEHGPEDEESKKAPSMKNKIGWTDQVRMIHLRRYIDDLAQHVAEKDNVVQMTREELNKCRLHIENLENERDRVFREIQTAEGEKHMSAIYRLRAQHERLCKELLNESELEDKIKNKLDKAEYDLAQAQVEQGKMILAEDKLLKKEDDLLKQRTDAAVIRNKKESDYANQAIKNRKSALRRHEEAILAREERHQYLAMEAKKSQEKANTHLKRTIQKMKLREAEEAEREKRHMEKRMTTMLALKSDISSNRENLKALQARDRAIGDKQKSAEDDWLTAIIEQGGNPSEEMLKQRKLEEFEKEKELHHLRQRDRQIEIAHKILQEDDRMMKRKQQQPQLFSDPTKEKKKEVKPHRKRKIQTLENATKPPEQFTDFPIDITKYHMTGDESGDEDIGYSLTGANTNESIKVRDDSSEEEVETNELAKPEFEGLWDQHKPYKVPKDIDDKVKLPGASKMEKEGGATDEELDNFNETSIEIARVDPDVKDVLDLPTSPTSTLASSSMVNPPAVHYVQHTTDTGFVKTFVITEPPRLQKKRNRVKMNALQLQRMRLQTLRKGQEEIMQRVLEKHREGIVVKQIAGGKEFKGCAFYSKPDVIHFKDFDVGKTYKKRVTLTNVSYSVNYCKLTGLTEHLKDFIELSFDPPGQMSAGLTCELFVTFKPMINEDLSGTVQFLSQTGPFQIPLICTTKKCDLKVDKNCVDFGTTVIGETMKRTFTLINNGAKGTRFDFYKVTGMKGRDLTTAETSLGRLTTADTNMRAVSPDSDEMQEKSKMTKSKKGKSVEKLNESLKEEMSEKKEDLESSKKDDVGTEGQTTEGGEETERTGELITDRTHDTVLDPVLESPLPAPHVIEELYSLDGMKVGPGSSGEIGPFSSAKLEIIWQPTIPGRSDTEFVVTFEDPDSSQIAIQALAHAIDVPVWVERQTVDLKICMFDRLYQDTIIVNNRATTALRLKFEVCKELRNHLELLPKTGYIQAQSQFSAQLKFLPQKSLFEEAGKYFDRETGVLEAPMIITVADQTRPVPFTVHAVVTGSDMQFDMTNIDFGHCTIYEATKATVKLTNHSILPQQFGFVGIPEYVDVQPNDGFGTLLPLETIELDIIFRPKKAREFSFVLNCKSLINREFKIKCKGVGVHPPLELTKQIVHFQATALYDKSAIAFHVSNSHISMNEFTHPVPRIGKGEIAPVGPTSFEFVVPEGAPVTISPSVGTVEPGKKTSVQVRFTPELLEKDIKIEAVRMVTKQLEAKAEQEYQMALEREKENAEAVARQERLLKKRQQKAANSKNEKGKGKPPAKGKASPKGRGKPGQPDQNTLVSVKGPTPIVPPEVDNIKPQSSEFSAAQASLIRQFQGSFQTFTIPCYIASGKCKNPGELAYSVHNTLYVDVHCPVVRPELVVISDNGKSTADFGDVSIGQSVIRSITVQNISDKDLDLRASNLDPSGPFLMLNALRTLPPDASHTLLICFTPHKGEVFQESLDIKCLSSTLALTLKGRGVSPMINLSVEGGVIDMGSVLAGEYREETFKINNTSTLSVEYSIRLDSQSLLRHGKAQGLPTFIRRDEKTKSLVGTQNNNGEQVFDCVPAEGVIPAGGSSEIMVTFAPDHSSDCYSDGIRIELFGLEEAHVFQIKGLAKTHIMYMSGSEHLATEVESLAVLPPEELEDDAKPAPTSILATVYSVAKETTTEFSQGATDITVGCVRTMAVSQKKNGEWSFDNLGPIQALGFNVDPPKGMLEAGTMKPVTVTWTPPVTYDPSSPAETSILCTLRGDVVEQYRVMLRGFVVSE